MLAKVKYICWEQWNHWYKWTSLLFALLFALTAYVLYVEVNTEDPPFVALGGSAYENVQGSILRDRTLFVSAGDKCNVTNHQIEVSGETIWRRLDSLGINIPGFKGATVYEPGECRNDLAFTNPLPEEITTGIWEYTGIETAHYDGKTHTRTWRTEPFDVETE